MKKKLLGLILALLMVFSLLPASAFAANVVQSGTCGDNMTWTLDDEGVLTITGTGEMTSSPWSDYKDSIKSVVIGDGVTSIYNYAFRGCKGLTDASIPNSIKTIGDYSFSGCTGLTEITIPDGVTKIEERTFSGCSSMTDIIIPNSVTSIDECAFSGCTNLKSVTLPESLVYIYYKAFSDCTNLSSIKLPTGLQYIEDYAFFNCTSLTSMATPDSVKSIGDGAFSNCTSLKNVDIKLSNDTYSMTKLPNFLFKNCSSLESVSFPNRIKSIGQNAFYGCNALKEIYFDGTDMQCAVINVEDGNDVLDDVTVYCALEYPFSDISNSGYRDYISLGQALGIVNGYPDGTFRPNNTVTRAQYITMLYNMYGKPDVSGYSLTFKDKNSISGPYVDAVKWGVAKGIINGYGDNTFRPDQQITRAQMAAFSYRLMKLAVGGEFKDEVKADCGFKDSSSIAKDYKEAVNVMANLGIITGFDTDNDGVGDTFRPNATANRGQAATIIVRVAISLGIVS